MSAGNKGKKENPDYRGQQQQQLTVLHNVLLILYIFNIKLCTSLKEYNLWDGYQFQNCLTL